MVGEVKGEGCLQRGFELEELWEKTTTRTMPTIVNLIHQYHTNPYNMKGGENIHQPHSKHNRNSNLLPRRQIQLHNLPNRHGNHNRIHRNVHKPIRKRRINKIYTFALLLHRPPRPRQVHGDAVEAVGEDPGDGDGGVEGDHGVEDVAEDGGLEDAEEEEAHGNFGEGD